MSKPLRSILCLAALAALLIPSRGFSVSAADPAHKFGITVEIALRGSRLAAYVYPTDDKGAIVSGATITLNNTPVLEGSHPGSYELEDFSVPFAAPFVMQFRFKPPSPPYWPAEISGTINIPNQLGIVKPQKSQTFTRGVGDGIPIAWRTSAGLLPVQIHFTANGSLLKWDSPTITASSLTVPWSSIPAFPEKCLVEVHGGRGKYGFAFNGPLYYPNARVFCTILDSREIIIKDLKSYVPKLQPAKKKSPAP